MKMPIICPLEMKNGQTIGSWRWLERETGSNYNRYVEGLPGWTIQSSIV